MDFHTFSHYVFGSHLPPLAGRKMRKVSNMKQFGTFNSRPRSMWASQFRYSGAERAVVLYFDQWGRNRVAMRYCNSTSCYILDIKKYDYIDSLG